MLVMANDKRVNEIIKRICALVAQTYNIYTYILTQKKYYLKKSKRARIYNRRKESRKKSIFRHP